MSGTLKTCPRCHSYVTFTDLCSRCREADRERKAKKTKKPKDGPVEDR